MKRYSRDQNPDGTTYIRDIPLYSATGNLAATTGAHRIYNDTGGTLNIVAVRASVGSASSSGTVTIDVKKNGTSIWSVAGNRPNIAAGSNTVKATNMTTTTWEDGTYLTVDIVSPGTGTVAQNLTVQITVG